MKLWAWALGMLLSMFLFQNCSDFQPMNGSSNNGSTSNDRYSIVDASGNYRLPEEATINPEAPLAVFLRNAKTTEGQPADILVILNRESDKDVDIAFSTFDGDAIGGTHYENTISKITIPAGATEALVPIPTLIFERSLVDRYFGIRIFESSVPIGQGQAGIVILGQSLPFQVASITSSPNHTCGVDAQGAAWCWGENSSGQLGNNSVISSAVPRKVVSTQTFQKVAVGQVHSCGVTTSGTVECWGGNQMGELGAGLPTTGDTRMSLVPVVVENLAGVVDVSVGNRHSCAVVDTGDVFCWGENGASSLLGTNNTTLAFSNSPLQVAGLANQTTIFAGVDGSCSVNAAGDVSCWGSNAEDKLGSTTPDVILTPQLVPAFAGAKIIEISGRNLCLQNSQDQVLCSGSIVNGMLGQDPANFATGVEFVPDLMAIPGLESGVANFAIGSSGHGCAAMDSGDVRCWGNNFRGQLGRTSQDRINPRAEATENRAQGNTPKVLEVSAAGEYSCQRTEDDQVRCWGRNSNTRLGSSSDALSAVPLSAAISGYHEIEFGSLFTCGLTSSNKVECWGTNGSGQLGNGGVEDSETPVEVLNLTGVRDIATSTASTCAILADKSVSCWGSNLGGLLGQTTAEDFSATPLPVTGLDDVNQLVASINTVCALTGAGEVFCWGTSGNYTPGATPQKVGTLANVRKISTGRDFACALLEDRTVSCWGFNGTGAMGIPPDPTRTLNFPNPVPVQGIANAADLASGRTHSCVILAGGNVRCWGSTTRGAIGIGPTTTQTMGATQDVAGDIKAKTLSLGNGNSCAVTQARKAYCWGANRSGQLGSQIYSDTLVPTEAIGVLGVDKIFSAISSTYFLKVDGSMRIAGSQASKVPFVPSHPILISKE